MNGLSRDRRERIIHCPVEGCSIRATSRLTGTHIETVLGVPSYAGRRAAVIQEEVFRQFESDHLQFDEVWTFVGMKKMTLKRRGLEQFKTPWGDWYIFTAMDTASRAIPVHIVGRRDSETTWAFVRRIRDCLNGSTDVEITTDAYRPYEPAITQLFGYDVDYGVLVKEYQHERSGRGRYAPPRVSRVRRHPICGSPRRMTTSYVERHNWTMRGLNRRMTRLSNGFSRKLENLKAQIALGYYWYNPCKPHRSLAGATPAIALGVTDRIWGAADVA